MSHAIDQHRALVTTLGGYAQTDQQRLELLKAALCLIADDCLAGEVEQATLERIRRTAVAAWHAATHASDPFSPRSDGWRPSSARRSSGSRFW